VICIHGVEGIGKTALLSFLAHFVHMPGRLFGRSVLYNPSWANERANERVDLLPTMWLEAFWRVTGREQWEQEADLEARGVRSCFDKGNDLQLLCEGLQREGDRHFLLVLDSLDRMNKGRVEELLGKLLAGTKNISVLQISDIRPRAVGGGLPPSGLHTW